MLHKQYAQFKNELQEGSREVISIITTDAIDRDNEVVIPRGLKKKNYGGNPVVLVNHDRQSLPVGVSRWIKPDPNNPRQLIAKTFITEKTQMGRDVWGLLQDGILGAISIGFIPEEQGPPTSKEIKARPELANVKNVIRSWEILEYSFVTVPSNPEALTLAVAKGCCAETLKFLNNGKDFSADDLVTPDYWDWTEAKEAPVDRMKNLPLPRYCRSVDSMIAQKVAQLQKRLDADTILDRYLGRV